MMTMMKSAIAPLFPPRTATVSRSKCRPWWQRRQRSPHRRRRIAQSLHCAAVAVVAAAAATAETFHRSRWVGGWPAGVSMR